MRRAFIISVLLTFSPLFLSCNGEDDAPQHATVTGFVYISGTDTPLPGVRVSVSEKEIPETALTDRNGTFTFNNVKTGTYEFNFDKEGYIQIHQPLQVSLNRRNHLDVPMVPIH